MGAFLQKNKKILGRGSVLIIYTSIAVKRVWLQFFKNSIIRDNHDIILILFSCYTLLQFWFWNCNTFSRSLCNLYNFLFLFYSECVHIIQRKNWSFLRPILGALNKSPILGPKLVTTSWSNSAQKKPTKRPFIFTQWNVVIIMSVTIFCLFY